MLENLNHSLFSWINATPASPQWSLSLATFIAQDLIFIIPALAVILWLWGPQAQISAQRQLVIKMAMALVISMALSWVVGNIFPHNRPFVDGVGHTFLQHAPDNSFPSDHGTAIFAFSLAFLFWHRLWSGLSLLVIGVAIAWSRVYLGVHWPLDMVGGFLSGLSGCLIAQWLWLSFGAALYQRLQQLYRLLFSLPIRKGWVRD